MAERGRGSLHTSTCSLVPRPLFRLFIFSRHQLKTEKAVWAQDYTGTSSPTTATGTSTIGSDRPSLKDLHEHVAIGAAGKWKDLGVYLLPQSGQAEMLKAIGADHPRDVVGCCKCVLEKWLDTTTDATWDQLITALRSPSIQLDYLASQLEQTLITECAEPACEELTNIQRIEVQFAKMANRIKQALISNNVNVASLIEQLCTISAVENKNMPLFDEDVFVGIKSIDGLWRRLRLSNVFGYELLRLVVEISGCREAQEILEEFLSKIDPTANGDVDLVLHCRVEEQAESLKPMLRIKVNTEKYTLSIKQSIEEILSKSYNLSKYAVCFQGMKEERCNELLYYMSKPLKLYLLQFKLSEGNLVEFLAHKIISLCIDEFELKIPSTIVEITNETVMWSVHTKEDTIMPGLTSKPRKVAVIIGNSYTRKDVALRDSQRELPHLPSSLADVYKLKKVFEYLQFFTVVKCNMTQVEFLESLLFPLSHSFGAQACHRFVFVFCGHGGDDFVYCEDEKCIKFSDIIEYISNYTYLRNVPRLFFFDVSRNAGTIPSMENDNWQSQISTVGDVLVAFSTSAGYQALESYKGSLWSNMLATKLITCSKDVHEVVMEANEELATTIQSRRIPCLQQPELLDKLSTTINLLNESNNRKFDFGFWELLQIPDLNTFIKTKESSDTLQCCLVELPNSGEESCQQLDDSSDEGCNNSAAPTASQQGLPAHKPAQMKIGCYIFGETVGHGTFGKVKLAKHEFTGHQVAVKILNKHKIKDMRMAEKMQREIQILKLLHHPHIIKLYEVIPTATDIFLILEYVAGGELFDYIVQHGKSTEKEARFFFQQIIAGVDYCHRHMVVHRDLKPENILLDSNNQVKIADFGLSNIMKDGELLKTSCGSLNYAAPEVVSRELYAGPEVDVWSCGIILFTLLCGYLPFDDQNVTALFKKIRVGYFEIPPYLSQEAADLVTSMLQVSPVKRITIHQIKDHEWFQQDLPEHLFPQKDQENTSDAIDRAVINEVCQKLGVKAEDVVAAIQSGDPHSQLNVAYHLVLDNMAMPHPETASSIPTTEHNSTVQSKPLPPIKKSYKPPKPHWPPYTSYAVYTPKLYPAGFKRSRWHLGIQSQSHPLDIMVGIFYKMKTLNFYWKTISPYHVLVKYDLPNKENLTIKLDLQLYQIDKRNYLLDLKNAMPRVLNGNSRLEGELVSINERPHGSEDELKNVLSQRHCTMEFFEISSLLIKALIV